MTPIDKLSQLLDECGVGTYKHEVPETICLAYFDGTRWHDCWESTGGEINVTFSMTPEQIVAATLGDKKPIMNVTEKIEELRLASLKFPPNIRRKVNIALDGIKQAVIMTLNNKKLTAEQVRKCTEKVYLEGYSDGSINRGAHIDETDWQAITNELNAILSGARLED